MTTTSGLLWLYVALLFVTALALLFSRWGRVAKLALVLAVTGLYFVADRGLADVWGWPAREPLPERFVLLAAVFDEPSPGRGHEGAIYIWVNPMKDNAPLAMPRVHRLPYEKDLHRILGDGLKKARDGNTQMGSTEPIRGPGGFSWLRPPGNDKLQIKLSDLPRAQLPEK